MLPSELKAKSHLFINAPEIKRLHRNLMISDGIGNHALYILSDDRIKKDDWVINTLHYNEPIHQCDDEEYYLKRPQYKKIIATTDNSLTYESLAKKINPDLAKINGWDDYTLPKPSQSFIQKYVAEYNKGNVIADIMVEYEEIVGELPFRMHLGWIVKVNNDTNTITIRKIKTSWTKEEIMNALHKVELKHNKNYSSLWEELEQNLLT